MTKVMRATAIAVAITLSAPSYSAGSVQISMGRDLEAACLALVQHDATDLGRARAEACRQYFAGLMRSAQASSDFAGRYEIHRLGYRKTETVCFDLSKGLTYEGFATNVTSYALEHLPYLPEPAVELAARSLAANHPCTS